MLPTPRPATWLSTASPVIDPSRFGENLKASTAIVVFSSSIFDLLVRSSGLDKHGDAPKLAGAVRGRAGRDIVLYESHFGASAAGMLMESLIASGVRKVFMFGQAGAVSRTCQIGHIVIPAWGLREEGTSYHYLGPEETCRPSHEAYQELKAILSSCPAGVLEGGVWTIDAPFRETRDKVEAYAAQGVLAVEMEFTALAAIAAHRKVEFAAVLVITDELYGEAWVSGFTEQRVQAAEESVAAALGWAFAQERRAVQDNAE